MPMPAKQEVKSWRSKEEQKRKEMSEYPSGEKQQCLSPKVVRVGCGESCVYFIKDQRIFVDVIL